MQTLNQFTEKIDELLNMARSNMRLRAERLFRSGAVDPESYEDNYILAKTILIACLLDEVDQWRLPPSMEKKQRREISNLRHF